MDGSASTQVALMGDMIAKSAEENNWKAVIINGCVRDVNELGNFNIGIFALGSVPRKSEKKDRGDVAISLKIGGVQVDSGSWAYADDNGVLVSKDSLKLD